MATFSELVSDVYLLTNRPDLVNETKMAVKAATLKAHHSDFYPKDLYETGVSWNPVSFVQSLEYRTLIPRWRALKYLRKYADGVAGSIFTIITPEQILDNYGLEKENICYLAGEHLEIKSSTEDEFMLLGCYIHPVVDEANYSSWIALDHPYAIVYDAAATVFKQIGWDEQSAQFRQLVAEQLAELKIDSIQAHGY